MRAEGPRRRLVGFEMVDRAVPRHGYPIRAGDRVVGQVTSGSFGPSVEKYIGMGYVPAVLGAVGAEFDVDVRGRAQRARVVQTPFLAPRVRK